MCNTATINKCNEAKPKKKNQKKKRHARYTNQTRNLSWGNVSNQMDTHIKGKEKRRKVTEGEVRLKNSWGQ
jgi:hypothetical protein